MQIFIHLSSIYSSLLYVILAPGSWDTGVKAAAPALELTDLWDPSR